MPSPFPGMDPYLESDLWTSFHAGLAGEIAKQLNPRLRPRYFALVHKRSVIDDPDDVELSVGGRYPDVAVLEARAAKSRKSRAACAAPYQMATIIPSRVPHFWVEIRDAKNRRLVTAIEILSPVNKRGSGRRKYLRKRRKILRSTAHLVEIDLLRKGRRVPMEEPLSAADYYVIVCHAEKRPVCDVWPISLTEPLPPFAVPLLKGDADVVLDLQEAFVQTYDSFSLDLAVDYKQPPDIPLPRELAAWLKERLRAPKIRR
jgi:hypothetical protein